MRLGHLVDDAGQDQDESNDIEAELAQKETEYNKASSNERFVERKVQASPEAVERLCKELES